MSMNKVAPRGGRGRRQMQIIWTLQLYRPQSVMGLVSLIFSLPEARGANPRDYWNQYEAIRRAVLRLEQLGYLEKVKDEFTDRGEYLWRATDKAPQRVQFTKPPKQEDPEQLRQPLRLV